jgi:hypothetical protein
LVNACHSLIRFSADVPDAKTALNVLILVIESLLSVRELEIRTIVMVKRLRPLPMKK